MHRLTGDVFAPAEAGNHGDYDLSRPGIVAVATYLPRYRLTAEEIARTHRLQASAQASRRLADRRGRADHGGRGRTQAARSFRPGPVGRAVHDHAALRGQEQCQRGARGARTGGGSARLRPRRVDALGPRYPGRGPPGTLLLTGDVSTARPGASAELGHGDAAAAVLLGDPAEAVAEIVDSESATEEILDQWRRPQTPWLQASEDRFTVSSYGRFLDRVLARLFKRVDPDTVDHVVVSAPSGRVVEYCRPHARPHRPGQQVSRNRIRREQ